jgi:hypothetical protein
LIHLTNMSSPDRKKGSKSIAVSRLNKEEPWKSLIIVGSHNANQIIKSAGESARKMHEQHNPEPNIVSANGRGELLNDEQQKS